MTIHVHLPQLIYVSMTCLGLCLTIRDHGKPQKPENAWTSIAAIVIGYSILIWGGFFR